VLELTALPSIKKDYWVPLVQETDALLMGGGDPFYLCYWLRHSGMADLLPSLRRETVYVGESGGSMVATPDFAETYDGINPPVGSDRALGLVDFALGCHLDREDLPDNSLANLEKWAAGVHVPSYAIDDQTAIKVVDGAVEVISEGHWKLLHPYNAGVARNRSCSLFDDVRRQVLCKVVPSALVCGRASLRQRRSGFVRISGLR
jgi:dipeptidase E